MSAGQSKTPWKNGFYYSDKNTAELKKFDGNVALTYSIGKSYCWKLLSKHLSFTNIYEKNLLNDNYLFSVNLDFPDLGPIGQPGTITYGDFGHILHFGQYKKVQLG